MTKFLAYMSKHGGSQDLPKLSGCDDLLGFQDRRVLARLKTNHCPNTLLFGQLRNFLSLSKVARKRPLAEDIFASFKCGLDEVVVLRYIDTNGYDVDIWVFRNCGRVAIGCNIKGVFLC